MFSAFDPEYLPGAAPEFFPSSSFCGSPLTFPPDLGALQISPPCPSSSLMEPVAALSIFSLPSGRGTDFHFSFIYQLTYCHLYTIIYMRKELRAHFVVNLKKG
jgi:hypothetical protein